jgi:hypothetical protein
VLDDGPHHVHDHVDHEMGDDHRLEAAADVEPAEAETHGEMMSIVLRATIGGTVAAKISSLLMWYQPKKSAVATMGTQSAIVRPRPSPETRKSFIPSHATSAGEISATAIPASCQALKYLCWFLA